VKNRMRGICTSGSVRDGDGNVPIYSAALVAGWREVAKEGASVSEAREPAENSSSHFGAEAVLVIANPAGLTVSKAVGAAR